MSCLTEDLSQLSGSLDVHDGHHEPQLEMARACASPGGRGGCGVPIGRSRRSGRKGHSGLLLEGIGIFADRCGARDAMESEIVRVLKDRKHWAYLPTSGTKTYHIWVLNCAARRGDHHGHLFENCGPFCVVVWYYKNRCCTRQESLTSSFSRWSLGGVTSVDPAVDFMKLARCPLQLSRANQYREI